MVNETRVVDNWIFEYLTYRCFKRYIGNGYNIRNVDEDENLMHDIEVLRSYLDDEDLQSTDSKKIFIFHLFFQLLCMECTVSQEGNEIHCAYITDEDDFVDLISKCIVFAARDTNNEDTKTLARHSLIQSYVVGYKYCLRKKTGQKEALKSFQDFVKLLPIQENQEMYDKCVNMKAISLKEDFISDYLESLKQLVVALYSELDDPALIKFAQRKDLDAKTETVDSRRKRRRSSNADENDTAEDEAEESADQATIESADQATIQSADQATSESADQATSELYILLQDKRPCKKSDLEEIKRDELGISRFRKTFRSFDKESHLLKVHKLERRIRGRPPSHQTFKVGAWMPEEEKAFVRKTLEIGAGYWKEIKTSLNSYRSNQQLKDKWRQLTSTNTIKELMKESQSIRHDTSNLIPLGRTRKSQKK